jgi:hypothetical protein
MHPTIGYHLSQHHLADLRHQAQRAALARVARRDRRPRPHQSSHPRLALPAIARHTLAGLRRNHSIAPAGRTKVLGGSDV